MRILLSLIFLSLTCAGQSSFDTEHTQSLEQNPPGITLTVATADGQTSYNFSDEIRFTLSFTSTKLHYYTVELGGGSAAGVSDDIVFIGPGMAEAMHSRSLTPSAYPCCESNRRYVTRTPFVRFGSLRLPNIDTALWSRWPLYQTTRRDPLQAGEYAIFVQTRSVMRGWPKSQREYFHSESKYVVTSNNILHLRILSDASDGSGAEH